MAKATFDFCLLSSTGASLWRGQWSNDARGIEGFLAQLRALEAFPDPFCAGSHWSLGQGADRRAPPRGPGRQCTQPRSSEILCSFGVAADQERSGRCPDHCCILALSIVCYGEIHASWILFAVLLLVPDLAILGYLRGTRIGTAIYNLVHTLSETNPTSRVFLSRKGNMVVTIRTDLDFPYRPRSIPRLRPQVSNPLQRYAFAANGDQRQRTSVNTSNRLSPGYS